MSDITERLRDLVYLEQDAYAVMEAADEIDRLRAELAGKEKALSAAKTVIEAKDKAYALIDQRFAAMAAKAATTDSERECNERLTAEIDALTAELAEARRMIDEARKQEPVAWAYHFSLHAYHDDFFDNEAFSDVLLKRRRELSPDDAFGRRGIDFDEKALITEVPLYAAPVPAQPAVPDDNRCPHCQDMHDVLTPCAAILSATDSEVKKDE